MSKELESFSRPSEQNIADLGKEKSRELTFGENLVGITFNPANDDKVHKAKTLCAQLADLIHEERFNKEATPMSSILFNHTVGEILNAQMNVVKLLTLKY